MNNSKLFSLSLLLVTLATISHDIFTMRRMQPVRRRRQSANRMTNILAVAEGEVIKVFNADTGRDVKEYYGHNKRINDLKFNHDGTRLAACANDDEKIIIWDSSDANHHNWTQLKTIRAHTKTVAFSPDGTKFAFGSGDGSAEGQLVIWDISNQDPEQWGELKAITVDREYIGGDNSSTGRGFIHSLEFNRTGTRLAFVVPFINESVHIFDTSNWQLLQVIPHGATNYSVAFSHDGRKLTTGLMDPSIRIWDISSRNPRALISLTPANSPQGNPWGAASVAIAFNHNGTRLASGSGNKLKIWDTTSWNELATLQGQGEEEFGPTVCSVKFNHNGTRLVTVTDDYDYHHEEGPEEGNKKAIIWDTSDSNPRRWRKLRTLFTIFDTHSSSGGYPTPVDTPVAFRPVA